MKERLYLTDVLGELLGRARAAEQALRSTTTSHATTNSDFEAGRLQGYYEVLSYLTHQLDAFGIPRGSVGWPDIINLERDLLS